MADRLLYLGILVVFVIVTHSPTSSGALFSPCSSDTNCTDVNAYCGTQNQCVCNETLQYIDAAFTCQQKVNLGDTCPSTSTTAPCSDLLASCQNTVNQDYRCVCNTGYSNSNGVCVRDCGSSIITINQGSATVTNTPTTFGSSVTVTCNTGYINPNPTTIMCQSTGAWTSATCSPIDCGSSINTVTQGSVTITPTTPTTFGSSVTVTCNTGYINPTPTSITCQSNGAWSSATCLPIDCSSSITTVTQGSATVSSSTFESTATVTCNTGYINPTPTTITCQSTGSWTSASCSPVDCGSSITTVTQGSVTVTTTTFGSSVTVTCNTGYINPTPTSITCQSNGAWSSATCSPIDCSSSITTVTQGSATVSSSTFRSTATVTCNTGYINPTPTIITCQSTGSWTSASCSPVDCGSSPSSAVTNGTATPTSGTTTYQSTANVICNIGYTASTPQIYCQSSEQWSTAVCRIRDCQGLSNPVNGLVSYGQTTYNAVATYTCNTGYIIDGTTSNTIIRTCTASGVWFGENPICSVKADPLGAVCPNPSTTNVQSGDLCNGANAFCLSRSAGSAEYTCQCNTAFYDDNGNDIAGRCQPVWDLRVQAIAFFSISTSSMVISWTPPTNKLNFIAGYIVEWKEKINSVQGSFSPVTTSTNYTISSSLTSGRAYTVKVTTRNVVDYTTTVKTTFLEKEQALKPQIPGAIVTSSSNFDALDKNIYATWTASTGDVSGYEWQLLEGSTVLHDGISTTANTNIGYTGFKNGYRYNMSITALSQRFDGNNVVKSETHTEEIKTVVKLPGSPTSVQCHMTTDTSVTIKWSATQQPNGDIVQYKIDTYNFNDNNKLKTNMTGNVNLMYEITGLQPGSFYIFYVSTVNELYNSIAARLQDNFCATRANVSEMPNNLNVSDLQSRSFVVTWTKPSRTYGENMGYIVQVRTADDTCVMELIRTCTGCTLTFDPSNLENMCASTVSTTDQQRKVSIDGDVQQSYIVTGLNPDVSYTVTVTAVNDAGRGKIASITVQTEEEVPQKPKDVEISDLTSTSCNVTWTIDGPKPGDTTFDVIVTAVSPVLDDSIQLTGFDQRRQSLSGLQEYWMYNVSVRATISKGSQESDPTPFTTLPAAPGPVDGFEIITSPGGGTVQVQWKIPVLLERNSEITMFALQHNTSTEMNFQTLAKSRNIDDTFLYQVTLNVTPKVTYQFRVYAINIGNQNGQETIQTLVAPDIDITPTNQYCYTHCNGDYVSTTVMTKEECCDVDRTRSWGSTRDCNICSDEIVGDDETTSNDAVIAAAIVVPLIVIIILIVVAVLIIRKRRGQRPTQNTTKQQTPKPNTDQMARSNFDTPKLTPVTIDMTSEDVMAWLHINDFIECKNHLKRYAGKDLLVLSKDDLDRICGAADGIRLYNKLRERNDNKADDDENRHYMDLDETKRDGVPYENIEMDATHMYSPLNYHV